jgi:hypothetical protein
MDAAALVDGAELIFVGTAVHAETVTSEDGTFPYTLVTFTVDEALKGATDQNEITLELAGGRLESESRIVEIPGMPRFDVDTTYLLFARGNGTGPCPLLGWKQGMELRRRHHRHRSGADPLVLELGQLHDHPDGDRRLRVLPLHDAVPVCLRDLRRLGAVRVRAGAVILSVRPASI